MANTMHEPNLSTRRFSLQEDSLYKKIDQHRSYLTWLRDTKRADQDLQTKLRKNNYKKQANQI